MELWPWLGRGSAMNAIDADDLTAGDLSKNKARAEVPSGLGVHQEWFGAYSVIGKAHNLELSSEVFPDFASMFVGSSSAFSRAAVEVWMEE